MIDEILKKANEAGASDIHMKVGTPPVIRVEGKLRPMPDERPTFATEPSQIQSADPARATGLPCS